MRLARQRKLGTHNMLATSKRESRASLLIFSLFFKNMRLARQRKLGTQNMLATSKRESP